MLPPKKWLTTGTSRMSSRARDATSGPSTRAPYSPVRMATGCRPVAGAGRRARPRGPVAGGRGPVDGGEEPGPDPEGGPLVPAEGGLEGPGHAQAVLVLGESLVGVRQAGRAARPSGSTRRRRTPSASRWRSRKVSCQRATVSQTAAASSVVWGRMAASWENRLTPRGTQATVARVGIAVEHAGQGVLQDGAVVRGRGTPRPGRAPRCPRRAGPAATAGWWPPGGCAAGRPGRRDRWRGWRRTAG